MDVSKEAVLLGEVKSFHSFNGAIQIPRGWMQCNGNVINQTNYDAIHGSGAYVSDGIADLVLAGKYTPNLIDKYLVGASTTSQTGSSAITSVGNANHTSPGHNHRWYDQRNSASSGSFDEDGNFTTWSNIGTGTTNHIETTSASSAEPNIDLYTENSTENIQPESIEVIFIIRVGV